MVHFPTLPASENKVNKGKAIPLQVWTGPEVSRMVKHPDFMTVGT